MTHHPKLQEVLDALEHQHRRNIEIAVEQEFKELRSTLELYRTAKFPRIDYAGFSAAARHAYLRERKRASNARRGAL